MGESRDEGRFAVTMQLLKSMLTQNKKANKEAKLKMNPVVVSVKTHIRLVVKTTLTLPTMTPCIQPNRVGSGGGSLCSSSSSQELSALIPCLPVVSSYIGGLVSS